MDTSAISLLALLMSLLGGGGSDLLDYVPSDTYWQTKRVDVTVDAMLAELKPPAERDVSGFIRDLGSPDPAARREAERQIRAAGPGGLRQLREAAKAPLAEVAQRAKALLNDLAGDLTARQVRRLVAIRTLGELKDARALPALRALLSSDEPFVADYAAAAVAEIEGKPYARARPAGAIAGDLALLPASCRAIGQIAPPRDGRAYLTTEVLTAIRPPRGMTPNEFLTDSAEAVIQLAEQVGNVRLHAVTAGIDGDLSDRAGFVVAAARGRYDAERLRSLLRQTRTPSHRVEDVEVFEPTGEVALLVMSDDLLIVCAAPRHADLPVRPLIAAARAAGGGGTAAPHAPPAAPRLAPEVAGLLKSIDTTRPAWAAARVTPAYRQLPLLVPFDTVTLTSQPDPAAGLRLTLVAQGHDPGPVEDAARQTDKLIRESAEFLKGIVGEPLIDAGAAFLQTARATADGPRLTLTATLKPSPAATVFLPTALGFGEGRPAVRPAPGAPPKVQ